MEKGNNENDNFVYYTLVESSTEYNNNINNIDRDVALNDYYRLMKKSNKFFSCSSFCLIMSFMSLLLAALLPTWSVNYISGPSNVFMVDSDKEVNFIVGSGIFLKNYCIFFDAQPSDEVLDTFGVNCDATSTLDGCEFDAHGRDINGNEECNRIQAAQSLSGSSIIFIIFGLVLGCCSSPEKRFGVMISFSFILFSVFSSYSVFQIMQETDMMKKSMTGCKNDFGAEICNEYVICFSFICLLYINLIFLILVSLHQQIFKVKVYFPL